MIAKYYIYITVAAIALLAFSVHGPAFSQMKNMPMKGEGEKHGHGKMMGMGDMDRMGDMMGMCIQHADMMGLTDDQIMKMKPLHREMQKKQARFEADKKIAKIELMQMLEAMKEMRTIITDEQFKKMQKMMPMMPMKMDEKKPAKKMKMMKKP